MKVTDFIVGYLKNKGVKTVFELSGGMIMQLIDSFHLDGGIKIISIHHEQAASFAADAVGRISGVPGVAIATSGPGATNLITGIGSCYFDSSPAVFITGQVNRHEQKGSKNIRQLGFQETDIVSMVKPITKWAIRIDEPSQVHECLNKAFEIACSGRPGPVVLDIPMDVFRAEIDEQISSMEKLGEINYTDKELFTKLYEDIVNAKKPIILAGGGINASGSTEKFRSLVEKLGIPVVNSLLAVDVLPYSNPLRIGMIGTYGNRWANVSLYESDLVLVLGSRLDIRQTGADTASFKGVKKIYHVDCETEEINNRILNCIPIVADLKGFINGFYDFIDLKGVKKTSTNWLQHIHSLKSKWPDTKELEGVKGINPNVFIQELSVASAKFLAYVVDVGQHQMWAAQSLRLLEHQRFITSGGMGAMGFALPAAIGISVNYPDPVCVIAGDAGFQLNIQELQTVKRNNLPIKMIVLNNQCHGMTRQFQETYFNGRYQSTVWGYSAPDFVKLAQAYGIDGVTIISEQEISEALDKMWATKEPFLMNVMIDTMANAYPKMAFGLPMSEMEPFAKPLEMEAT